MLTSTLSEVCLQIRADLQKQQAELRESFFDHGRPGDILAGRSKAVDAALSRLWQNAAMPPEFSLAAVGGYGRGELYPGSDVDLLILTPELLPPGSEPRLEALISAMWDTGVEVGHSIRSPSQCLETATVDITVQTNLLEARFLAGNRQLFASFQHRFREQLDPLGFLRAKRLEQEQRYGRFNDTPYCLEPNCKESPGGLRDLHVMLWVARASGFGRNWSGLAENGLITSGEALQLRRIESFLQQVRIHLHYLARRREDRLLFDFQEALAKQMGIGQSIGKRASENVMQRYYRTAKAVTQLNTIVLENLSDKLAPGSPVSFPINACFQSKRERLDVRSEDVFERHPEAILESFLLMQQRSELKGMTPRTLRALWRARGLINAEYRRNPKHRALFMQLFQQRRGLIHEFRRMNQWGILGRYLPAFGRIVGQMQHDLFHVYTVDQHILQVLRNLRRFSMAEHAHEYPLCSRLITSLDRYWLLYVAAIFHDIAKGRGGDHSRLGMGDALTFCRQHGLDEADTELVVFLVEHHLSMSSVAQKQDLADPDVIKAFAGVVKTERRLVALYLLTVADIRGTSPKVWNGWKGKLLEDLFHATRRFLRGATAEQALGSAERQDDALRLLRYYGLRPGVESELWRQLDTAYFMRHDAEEVAWHTRMLYYRASDPAPVVKARPSQTGEGLQVMVYTPDQRDLFMRLCGYFGRLGFTIVDAKIHTTRHGYALDSFVLLDPQERTLYRDVISLLEHELIDRLYHPGPPDEPAPSRISRQVKHFPISPEVSIRVDEKGNRYIMFVSAADRPGLLFAVARVLANHDVVLHAAKIATMGERVEDTFLISGSQLGSPQSLLRIERELLAGLQI